MEKEDKEEVKKTRKPHKKHVHKPKPPKTHRICCQCKEDKPITDFYDTRNTYCRDCFKLYQNKRYNKIKKEFYNSPTTV
jgi:hypothetical protein